MDMLVMVSPLAHDNKTQSLMFHFFCVQISMNVLKALTTAVRSVTTPLVHTRAIVELATG